MMKPLTGPWFLFLLFAGAVALAFGIWEIKNGRGSAGVGLIVIAVADVLIVGAARVYRARRDQPTKR
jgi:hypothetical protein